MKPFGSTIRASLDDFTSVGFSHILILTAIVSLILLEILKNACRTKKPRKKLGTSEQSCRRAPVSRAGETILPGS